MLYKNIVSGNTVSATDPGTIALMERSPNYIPVVSTPAPESVAEKPAVAKVGKKPTKSKEKQA